MNRCSQQVPIAPARIMNSLLASDNSAIVDRSVFFERTREQLEIAIEYRDGKRFVDLQDEW